ncbi:dienelactone hydrolase family protein [Pseudolysobacter antarcticus]|uniref:Dienelactone hydrolase family protein n=1 Tax=Pseudolysobacter antarcticus TaxID=2511995 RepID=A0A411HGV7_9GAMM|nr:dienelactone hydrolase family protein [Pseudolysobacter antarcticus]QBB69701.1 dienelactone hydrolase family protein [Pseudolysobacter antarcticus]
MKLRHLFVLLATFSAASALAAPTAKPVNYKIGDTEFQGQLIYDDAIKTSRPGLVMVPNWYGINTTAIEKAKMIAGRDYVIFLADMYGKDAKVTDDASAQAVVKPLYADRELMRTRIKAGLAQLQAQIGKAPIDAKKLGAIGFCFGGSAVLDLGRAGADIAAIVTFHGQLSTDKPELAKNIKAKVLVLNGADDKGVGKQVDGFEKEMTDANVDWQFVNFSGAVHCFTETESNSPGCKYDEKVSKRAYVMMHNLLGEAFAGR